MGALGWALTILAAIPLHGCGLSPSEPGVKLHTISASGSVRDTDGNPVESVGVYIEAVGPFEWGAGNVVMGWKDPFPSSTDPQGRYETATSKLPDSGCERAELRLSTGSHAQTVPLHSCRHHEVDVIWDTESGDVFWEIWGPVRGEDGMPLGNVLVEFTDWDRQGNTFLDAGGTTPLTCNPCFSYSAGTGGFDFGNWSLSFAPPSTGECYDVRVTATLSSGPALTDTVHTCGLVTWYELQF